MLASDLFSATPMGLAITNERVGLAQFLFVLGARTLAIKCADYAIGRHEDLARWFVLQGDVPHPYSNSDARLGEWRRQFCACRARVVAWLSVKRFHGRALVHVDRFLMRQIAMAIWQTRGE